MRNILVTGGAGYIGAVLVKRLLQDGFHVTVLDNFSRRNTALLEFCAYRHFDFVCGDIRDEALVKSLLKTTDAIVGLAAQVSPKACENKEQLATDVNVTAVDLLNKLRSNAQPVFFPSTNIGYGTKAKSDLYTEDSPLEPNSIYGKTKVAAERLLMDRGEFVIFRPASAFGVSPSMKSHLLVNYYVSKAVADGYIVAYEPDSRRNFIHVEDVARCFSFCITNYHTVKNEIYNIGLNTANITKRELIELIQSCQPGVHAHYAEIGADPDRRDYLVSTDKIERKGFTCENTLRDGIQELIKYYKMKSAITRE